MRNGIHGSKDIQDSHEANSRIVLLQESVKNSILVTKV